MSRGEFNIEHSTYDVWGHTRVTAKFPDGTLSLALPGKAEVATTTYGFKTVSCGASMITTYHAFRPKLAQPIPPSVEHHVRGAIFKLDYSSPPLTLRPEPGTVFVVSIGPADIVITSDDGLTEVLRTPFGKILAMILETDIAPHSGAPVLLAGPALPAPAKLLTSS